jgi:hypothetical protein
MIKLLSAELTFTQEPDSNAPPGHIITSDNEIKVKLEDAGGGLYFVIETERWAFDSPEELHKLLKDIEGLLEDIEERVRGMELL